MRKQHEYCYHAIRTAENAVDHAQTWALRADVARLRRFENINCSPEEIESIYRLVCGVLLIGEIEVRAVRHAIGSACSAGCVWGVATVFALS